jgi:Tfp pilus assembly protein PilO
MIQEDIIKLATDDRKLGTIKTHGQLILNILLIIALTFVCYKFMQHMEDDAAKQEIKIREDQEVIKMWRDSQIQSNRMKDQTEKMEDQTNKIDEIYRQLNSKKNVRH